LVASDVTSLHVLSHQPQSSWCSFGSLPAGEPDDRSSNRQSLAGWKPLGD